MQSVASLRRGDSVWWYHEVKCQWRTGTFERVVEQGRKFGMAIVVCTGGVPRREIHVPMDRIEPIAARGKGVSPAGKGTRRVCRA